jgi:hypothetical protein
MFDELYHMSVPKQRGLVVVRALQTYMHEFHADRDHAMRNIQNRTIPVVQLTQLQLSMKNF